MTPPEPAQTAQAGRPGRRLTCPRCAGLSLEGCSYEGSRLNICTHCHGLWCEPSDWNAERLGEAPVVGPFRERAADLVAGGPSDLDCPECSRPLTVLKVREVRNLEIDQCDRCGGVWFDHREWEYLEALRSWQEHSKSSRRTTTWSEWLFQLLLHLPVEFNVPPRRFPLATVSIIFICLAVQLAGGAERFVDFGMRADDPSSLRLFLTAVTHQFLHGSWLHLLGNLYFLFILGDNIEDVLGPARYLLLFLACGVIASAAQVLLSGGDASAPLVGASGAVAGVMAAYLVLFQRAQLTFMLILFQFKVPVWAWMGLWLAVQIAGSIHDPSGRITHVGWVAHIGGFAAGFLLVWPFRARLIDGHPLLHLLHARRMRLSRRRPDAPRQ